MAKRHKIFYSFSCVQVALQFAADRFPCGDHVPQHSFFYFILSASFFPLWYSFIVTAAAPNQHSLGFMGAQKPTRMSTEWQ